MKNITLVESDSYQLLAKIYADKSVRLVEKWKHNKAMNRELFLTSGEIELLLENIEG